MEILGLIKGDSYLEPFVDVITKRHKTSVEKLKEIKGKHKNLRNAVNSYLFYGLHRTKSGWVLREWAPNATSIYLIGDFSDWKKSPKYRFTALENGNWEISVSDKILKHGDLYRLFIEWSDGEGDRLPSHVRRVVQDSLTGIYSAQVWCPEEYKWHNPRPPKIQNPLIYEVHIGMCMENRRVSTFNEFRSYVLPRIARLGYNAIQIMGIQEHPYYGSFGYQVSNFFAVSSRFGTPEDLKALVDAAHAMGIGVIMDIVHSHSVLNENEGLSNFAGDKSQFFYPGERGYHKLWNSRCFDYGKSEVLNFLLSNCKFWMEEFNLDGFRFDGITSMLYMDHGLGRDFTEYKFYFDGGQDENAVIYLSIVNELIHDIYPDAITIAEDMSGMPGLAAPLNDGGMGFDFRMSMGVPDYWIKLIKEKKDEEWHVGDLFYELTNKRKDEHTVSYAESHDQAMVGDKTIFFRLLDKDIYDSMGVTQGNLNVERAMSLHKMIRLLTISTAGDGYLNFMGNEWGHPEWIDFPREGNNWSYDHARRQWSLVDDKNLRFRFLNYFDIAMIAMVKQYNIFNCIPQPLVRDIERQILIFNRGNLLFVFNFSPNSSWADYVFETSPGKYITVLNTDDREFDGAGRSDDSVEHFTIHKYQKNLLSLYIPSRSAIVLKLINE